MRSKCTTLKCVNLAPERRRRCVVANRVGDPIKTQRAVIVIFKWKEGAEIHGHPTAQQLGKVVSVQASVLTVIDNRHTIRQIEHFWG
jgi:hypothetical protein